MKRRYKLGGASNVDYKIQGLAVTQPIFSCPDPIQGTDILRSQTRNPRNVLPDYDATSDVLVYPPERYLALMMFRKLYLKFGDIMLA